MSAKVQMREGFKDEGLSGAWKNTVGLDMAFNEFKEEELGVRLCLFAY
jgi:hypothetical protein